MQGQLSLRNIPLNDELLKKAENNLRNAQNTKDEFLQLHENVRWARNTTNYFHSAFKAIEKDTEFKFNYTERDEETLLSKVEETVQKLELNENQKDSLKRKVTKQFEKQLNQ